MRFRSWFDLLYKHLPVRTRCPLSSMSAIRLECSLFLLYDYCFFMTNNFISFCLWIRAFIFTKFYVHVLWRNCNNSKLFEIISKNSLTIFLRRIYYLTRWGLDYRVRIQTISLIFMKWSLFSSLSHFLFSSCRS